MAADAPDVRRRVALITGGTRGIGLGIAKELIKDGYTDIILGYNSDAQAANKAKALLEQTPGVRVECVGGDVSRKEAMEALFKCVADNFNNQLEAFIHNAGLYIGITSTSDCQPTARDDFEETWPYYYAVYVLAFKRGLELALKCQGLKHVVAVSGQGCNCNSGPRLGYEAPGQAKSSLEFLVRLHGLKLASQGTNVNCIIPGYTQTEAWSKFMSPEASLRLVQSAAPTGTWASPEEVGAAAAFLASPRASLITGVSIPVDGGLHLSTGPRPNITAAAVAAAGRGGCGAAGGGGEGAAAAGGGGDGGASTGAAGGGGGAPTATAAAGGAGGGGGAPTATAGGATAAAGGVGGDGGST